MFGFIDDERIGEISQLFLLPTFTGRAFL